MGDERTAPRERWVLLTWSRHDLRWDVHSQWGDAYEEQARSVLAVQRNELGMKNVRLIHTSSTE